MFSQNSGVFFLSIFSESFMNFLSQPVMITDPEGILMTQNSEAKRLFNFPTGTRMMESLKQHFEVHGQNEWPQELKRNHEWIIVRKETDLFQNLFLKVQLICESTQEGLRCAFIFKDVTDEYQEDILKQEFLTLISHKLRTPVVALSYAMNLMLRRKELGFSEEEVDDFLNQAYLKSFEISELIEKMIRYCSVEKDKLMELPSGVNWNELMEEVLKRYDKKYKGHRIPYVIRMPKNLPESLSLGMHKEYVFLIMENLIDNAIKFNSKETAIVEINGDIQQDKLRITVTDNGPGIPPEYKDQIFLPFVQIEKFFSGAVEGVGLGLPVVKKILESHGETLWMDSVIDQGTKVIITLPLHQSFS